MKTQIEHSQHLVERSQVKLQKDFDNWWQEQCELIEQKNQRHQEYDEANIMRKTSTAESVASTIPSANRMLSNSRSNLSLNTTLNTSNNYQVIKNLMVKLQHYTYYQTGKLERIQSDNLNKIFSILKE